MLHLGKNGPDFIIIETNRAITLELSRAEAKALARFLLVELNIVEFYLQDGTAGHLKDLEFQKLITQKWGHIQNLTK